MATNNEVTRERQLPLDLTVFSESSETTAVEEETAVWSDQAIQQLKWRLLKESLKDLSHPRIGDDKKREILFWVAQPLLEEGVAKPLSFQDCCISSGYNPFELKQLIGRQCAHLM